MDNIQAGLQKLREAIESELQWGSVDDWTTKDFERLREAILEKTGVALSITTLKRLLGRVHYEATPNISTLDAMARFLGYAGWRPFEKSLGGASALGQVALKLQKWPLPLYGRVGIGLLVVVSIALAWISISPTSKSVQPEQAAFEVQRLAKGLPNTVVFYYDAHQLPGEKIEIQQDWDPGKRVQVRKDKKAFTAFYNYPGYFDAKLLADGQIIKRKDLFIPSDGWMAAIDASGGPRYLLGQEVRMDSILRVSDAVYQEILQGEDIQWMHFFNLIPGPGFDSQNFTFYARFRHSLRTGRNICQHSKVLVYGTTGVLSFPFCIPGCVGQANVYLNGHFISGKENNLSGFGCQVGDWVDFRLVGRGDSITAYVNGAKALQQPMGRPIGQLGGVGFSFKGAGEVALAKVTNAKGEVLHFFE